MDARRPRAAVRLRYLLLAILLAIPVGAATPTVAAAATTCYAATPTWSYSQSVGTRKAWYNLKWCASGGKITSTSLFWCNGSASVMYSYRSCSVKTTTGTGSSYYGVSGKWTYRSGALGVYLDSFITVSAKHYADGRYSGTWCLNC